MARFTRSFVLLSVFIILTSAGLYGVSESVAPVYPEVWKPIKILEGKEEQIEVITLRNSHNRAIHFDTMGMEGFHLWRGGGDIFEAKYVLRNVYPDLDSLQYVLVPFQGFVFDNSTSDYRSEKRREWYSLEKFGLDYLKGDATLFVRGRLVDPIIRPDHWRGIFYPSLSFLLRSKEVKRNGWVGPRSTDHIAPESIPKQAARRAQKHIDIHKESIFKNKDLCKDAISSIKDMSNTIEKNSLIVIYKPPYTKKYTET
ncbi:hypothetical protein [Salinibacter sp.]|uniref:hypothetical protein n=1 Tax=Salinibacter sp. TaxID=2065818 RepID=UPI0021E8D471|nr:hypothetical protein [Salinibacter sp.]